MQNKQMKPLGLSTKFYRPMIIFDYDESKTFQKCFAYSSLKSFGKEGRDGLISFKIPKYEKLFINCPILVPTKYLKQFEFKNEIEHEQRQTVKDHLEYLEGEYRATVKESGDILYQYKCIKYNSDYLNKFDFHEVQRAHNKMINEHKVEEFCKRELELIKQQEQLLIDKSKNESGNGSSGAPNDGESNIEKIRQ
jgi:radical SAM superfamily enzyme with C-terminal helix-hairpin-helix motif